MTGQTPLHVHVRRFPRQRHLIHPAVACFASHAFVDVDAVIEIDKIGKVVDPIPAKRLVLAQAGPYRLEHVAVSPDLFVTVHADRGGGDTGESADFDSIVTIPAIDADSGDMMRMAERNRLIERYSLIRNIWRINDCRPTPRYSRDNKDPPEYRQPRDGIGCSFEDLRHGTQFSADSRAASTVPEQYVRIREIFGGRSGQCGTVMPPRGIHIPTVRGSFCFSSRVNHTGIDIGIEVI